MEALTALIEMKSEGAYEGSISDGERRLSKTRDAQAMNSAHASNPLTGGDPN